MKPTSKRPGTDVISGPKYKKTKIYKQTEVKMIIALKRPSFADKASGASEYIFVPSEYNQNKINKRFRGRKAFDRAKGSDIFTVSMGDKTVTPINRTNTCQAFAVRKKECMKFIVFNSL